MIEAHVLRQVLDYDPENGAFHWKIRPAKNVRIGQRAGCPNDAGWVIRYNLEIYRARRLAWLYVHGEINEGMEVRVINRDENDVRLANLELQTPRQRLERHSMHQANLVGFRNIYVNGDRFRVQIHRRGKAVHRSSHRTLVEAIAARDDAFAKLQGPAR